MKRILFLGYGNPGRLDDGLGPAFAEALEELGLEGVSSEADYQLTVEDAAGLRDYQSVVFVDASTAGEEPFEFLPIAEQPAISFSTHSIKPQGVLALARELFGIAPRAYLLSIRGYDFNEFGEKLSEKAKANLGAALHYAQQFVAAEIRAENY